MAFPDTRWSMLAVATAHGDALAMQALDEFCRLYWKPVFAVVRSRANSLGQAEEQTQAFFVELLEKATLRRADPTRGKFRTFLLTVLWRFLRDERRRANAEKRGGGMEECNIEDVEAELASDDPTLAEVLDREWALAVVERALESVRRGMIVMRGDKAWQVLRGFLPGSTELPAMSEAARALGITEAGARTEIHRLRARCREALRRELMSTVTSPDELEEEIAYLGRALRSASAAMS